MRMELLTDYRARRLIPFPFGIIPGNPLSTHDTGTINLIPLTIVLIHCQPRKRTPCLVNDSFASAEYYTYKRYASTVMLELQVTTSFSHNPKH